MLNLLLALCALILLYIIYNINKKKHNFWKELNVPFLKPLPFIGNIGPIILLRKQVGIFFGDIYKETRDKPYIGIYVGGMPCLIVNDYNLVEEMLIRNFPTFSKRLFSPPVEVDPLTSRSLFSLHGYDWKVARSKLSPGFTTLKLKSMLSTMNEVADKLSCKLKTTDRFYASDISARFAIDTINCAVFGFNGKAVEDPENDGLYKVYKLMTKGIVQSFKNISAFIYPDIMIMFGLSFFSKDVNKYIMKMADTIIQSRSDNDYKRNDFMEMLLEQRKSGGWKMENGRIFELDGENFAAQIFIFMTAGFDTSASGLTFALFELAKHQEVQNQVRNEINDIINKHGSLTHEALNEMKYMDMVIKETLRLYPPFPFLDKVCTGDFKLPGSDIVIPKNTFIMIPTVGLHNDERNWPEPEKYDPERFRDPENYKGKPYLPFGIGLRTCLGNTFAMIQIKMGLIAAVKDRVLTTEVKRIAVDPTTFNLKPKEDIVIFSSPLK